MHGHRKPALVLLAVVLPALAADGLAVKPGLWETTTVTTSTGIDMPAEAMAQMPPAQRAQVEAMMKQMGVGAPSTRKDTSCVTAEDLKEGVFKAVRENDNPSCRFNPVKATSRHQELEMTCNGENKATGRMTIDVIDSGNIRGAMDMKTPQMTMNMKFTSRWLSASCAGADKN